MRGTMGWSWDVDKEDIEDSPEVFRASGDCVGDVCGLTYYKHRQPYKATCPTVVVACDGRYLKL
jgi:hypothetical protein